MYTYLSVPCIFVLNVTHNFYIITYKYSLCELIKICHQRRKESLKYIADMQILLIFFQLIYVKFLLSLWNNNTRYCPEWFINYAQDATHPFLSIFVLVIENQAYFKQYTSYKIRIDYFYTLLKLSLFQQQPLILIPNTFYFRVLRNVPFYQKLKLPLQIEIYIIIVVLFC